MKKIFSTGNVVPAILVISSTFIIIIYAVLLVLATQLDFSNRDLASARALHIAESGLDYYRWHLNEDPSDYTDGTGILGGAYTHDLTDSEGAVIGSYTLEITPPTDNSNRVVVRSTGSSTTHPALERTVVGVFGRRPLTSFAFLHNSNIWFGQEITINGPIYTNGGIRMDGTNTSTVQTTKETYTCGAETGCSSPTVKPGIWGNGGPKELWEFPVPVVDFESITIDFNDMKIESQTKGLYLPASGKQGYRIEFKSDATFDVFSVDNAQSIKGYSYEFGCENIIQDIKTESYLATYPVSNYPLIFAEDDVWVGGTVNGKVTVVAARFPVDTDNADIIILDNLVYLSRDGNHSLGLVSQNDIIIGEQIPEELEINGGLLAQNGRVIRHHYNWSKCSKGGGADSVKGELIIYGSVISNLSSYWNFSGGPGVSASGFVKTTISYDPNLENDPPDYFPDFGAFSLISWSEE